MGNWCTLEGPYVFITDDYNNRRWVWLGDINLSFIEEVLSENFICSDKP